MKKTTIEYAFAGGLRQVLQVALEVKSEMGMDADCITHDMLRYRFHEADARRVANGTMDEEDYLLKHPYLEEGGGS